MRSLVLAMLVGAGALASAQLTLTTVVSGLTNPVAIAQPPGETRRIFIVQQGASGTALIRIFDTQTSTLLATPFLTVSGIITGGEQGLLGLAFHPQYATNGKFYVNLTANPGTLRTEIREYTVSLNPNVANTTFNRVITINQPFTNHNGGTIEFGPDGFLYIGMGDGGSSNDPGDRALNPNDLQGKMLRVDVDGDDFPADTLRNYRIPAGNPFAGATLGADEIWSTGHRNPWKWSFDPQSQNGFDGMTIADVGQNAFEEVNFEPANTPGRNYGWRRWEANQSTGLSSSFGPATATSNTAPYTGPIWWYGRTIGQSVSGGDVYRGTRLGPEFWGHYFVADYLTSNLWRLPWTWNPATGIATYPGAAIPTPSLTTLGNPVAVTTLNDRELYVVTLGTDIVGRITRTTPSRELSGNIVFSSLAGGAPVPNGVNIEIDNLATGPSPDFVLPIGTKTGGAFRIPVPTGNLRVSVKVDTWLRRTIDVSTTSGDASGAVLSLVNGNANGDGEIGPADFSAVLGAFGSEFGGPGYVRASDLDRNGEVGPSDFSIVLDNFGAEDDAF